MWQKLISYFEENDIKTLGMYISNYYFSQYNYCLLLI